MKKNAIIDIIANDLKEMQILLDTFKDFEKIPNEFIELLESKHNALSKEIQLLNNWSTSSQSFEPSETETPKNISEKTDDIVEKAVVDESKHSKPEPTIVETIEPIKVAQPQKTVESEIAKPTPIEPTTPQQIIKPKVDVKTANDIKNYGTPVDDIRKAIGIADRFLFQRELFDNNADKFNQVIDAINAFTSFDEANAYLNNNFGWDETEQTVESFLRAVHRRFIK